MILRPVCQIKVKNTDSHASLQSGIILSRFQIHSIQFRQIKNLSIIPVPQHFHLKLYIDFRIAIQLCQHIQNPLLLPSRIFPQKISERRTLRIRSHGMSSTSLIKCASTVWLRNNSFIQTSYFGKIIFCPVFLLYRKNN